MKYKPTFWLKDSRQSSTSIICYVHVRGERFRLTTGLVVKPSNWSKARQRVKAGDTHAATINDRLDRIERDIGEIIMQLQTAGRLTPEAIGEAYAAKQAKPAEELTFLQRYEKWIEDQAFRPGTKRNHRKVMNHFRKFSEKLKVKLSFEMLNVITWERFVRHLIRVEGMTNDSAWNVLKTAKAYVASAYEQGWHRNDDFKRVSKKRLVPKGESNSDMVYLSERELAAVVSHDLPDRLARVRDLFCFLCYSGIRYGDSQRLGPEHRIGNSLQFVTGKNRSKANVPLLPEALRIWEAYEGTLPKISNQKGNDYLTEALTLVAKTCKSLKEPVTVVRFKETERIETTMPKFEAVGLHSGKRTYISLSLSRGATLEALAKVTGNTIETLKRYDVRSGEDAAELVREVWQ